ncbi:hypothetical protein PG994_009073 [Apiospora phragmitis]|uniref:CCHC-type domain-containing protein n=1 Tax=Apiospora phragmitis TaxID=2905665 RepID=A0ABR1UKM5_9PEZI
MKSFEATFLDKDGTNEILQTFCEGASCEFDGGSTCITFNLSRIVNALDDNLLRGTRLTKQFKELKQYLQSKEDLDLEVQIFHAGDSTAKDHYFKGTLDLLRMHYDQSHNSSDCPNFVCKYCDRNGHIERDCRTKTMTCNECQGVGHNSKNCPEAACKICGSDSHVAKDCDQPPKKGDLTCYNCKQEGHKAKDCTEVRKVNWRRCREQGHMVRDCPQKSAVDCYRCSQEGHIARNCPQKPAMNCYRCGQEGHRKHTCSQAGHLDPQGHGSICKYNTKGSPKARGSLAHNKTRFEMAGKAQASDFDESTQELMRMAMSASKAMMEHHGISVDEKKATEYGYLQRMFPED